MSSNHGCDFNHASPTGWRKPLVWLAWKALHRLLPKWSIQAYPPCFVARMQQQALAEMLLHGDMSQAATDAGEVVN